MDSSDDESDSLHKLLDRMQAKNMTASHVVLALLTDPDLQEHTLTKDLVSRAKEVLTAFETNSNLSQSTLEWASAVIKARYAVVTEKGSKYFPRVAGSNKYQRVFLVGVLLRPS